MDRNLKQYLNRHPECEKYSGQDRLLTSDEVAYSNDLFVVVRNDLFVVVRNEHC